MEVYEKINLLLKEKKITKKEFAHRLRELEPKLKNTGEIPSEKVIYSYLSGQISLKIELIPFIAEALDIPEQILFDDTNRARMNYMKYILKELTQSERVFLQNQLCNREDYNQHNKRYNEILDLLEYAPQTFIDKLKISLQSFKDIFNKMNF